MSSHDYYDRILKEHISILYTLKEDRLNLVLKYLFLPALATPTHTHTLL